jgi:hypothetical protein
LFVDASADAVGIKTSSPQSALDISVGTLSGALTIGGDVNTSTGARTDATRKYGVIASYPYTNANRKTALIIADNDSAANNIFIGGNQGSLNAATLISFYTAANNDTATGTERMRIDSSGNLLVGTTGVPDGTSVAGTLIQNPNSARSRSANTGTTQVIHWSFYNGNGEVGGIFTNGSATTFYTSSDYRLKENVSRMTGALDKVTALNPVTYKWKVDGAEGQGFIAHELQEVAPYAVSGEKDGEEMQGVDYGKITPLLTAALQEAIAEIQSLKARVAELEAK